MLVKNNIMLMKKDIHPGGKLRNNIILVKNNIMLLKGEKFWVFFIKLAFRDNVEFAEAINLSST